jgi:hypothetical protein
LGEFKAYLLHLVELSALNLILCWKKEWGVAKLGKDFTFERMR